MVVFPCRGWWRPGGGRRGGVSGVGAAGWVPVVVVGRASRSWAVVFPAGVPAGQAAGGAVVCPASSVRLAAAGGAGQFGREAWRVAWAALGGRPWSAVWPRVAPSFRRRWPAGVPGSLASGR